MPSMMRTAFILLTSCTVLLTACGGARDEVASGEFWGTLRVVGEDAEVYDDLETLESAADIVAVGNFIEFTNIRTIQGDAVEDILFYGQGVLHLTEHLGGSDLGPPDRVTIEFILPAQTLEDAEDLAFSKLASVAPTGELLIFLREKRGASEEGLYRPVNSFGIWEDSSGSLTAPLADDREAAARLVPSGKADSVAELIELVLAD